MANNFLVKLLALYSWICYYCNAYIRPVVLRMWVLTWTAETVAVRFCFGWASLGFAYFVFKSPLFEYYNAEYHLMSELSPYWINPRAFWGILFTVHGISLLYGVASEKYSTLLLVLEGLLGVAIWGSSAAAIYHAQGTPGAHTVTALIALWILARYPTHAEYMSFPEKDDIDKEELLLAMHMLSGEDTNDN